MPRKTVKELEPWELSKLVPYSLEYLSGFQSEVYQIELTEGFNKARSIMDDAIHDNVKRDIGGDEQRIASVKTQHNNVTFKHILL